MRQNQPKKTDAESNAVEVFLYNVLELGYKIGGVVFVAVAFYLLWGILVGSLSGSSRLSAQDYQKIAYYAWRACDLLTISGVVVIVCAAARFYSDETTGYVLLLLGALVYLGMPFTVNPGSEQVAPIVAYIIDQFRLVGVVALLVSIPFMIYNLWRMIRSERILKARAAEHAAQNPNMVVEKAPSRFGFSCWNSMYCREHMRKICDAYRKRKSCWRIGSGCYCDEEMILKTLKAGSGADNKLYDALRAPSKKLSWMQKRRRCKECIIYIDHRNLQYKILSPLGIVIPAVLTLVYFDPLKDFVHRSLLHIYEIAGRLSIIVKLPETGKGALSGLVNSSGMAENILVICMMIFASAIILKLMEHFLFTKWI